MSTVPRREGGDGGILLEAEGGSGSDGEGVTLRHRKECRLERVARKSPVVLALVLLGVAVQKKNEKRR